MNYIIKKIRPKLVKEGASFIEMILLFPLFVVSIWIIIQLMLMSYSNNQMNTFSNTTAAFSSHFLRGNQHLVNLAIANTSTEERIYFSLDELGELDSDALLDSALDRMVSATSNNGFILFGLDQDGNDVKDQVETIKNKDECEVALKDKTNPRVLCVYIQMDKSAGSNIGNFQVVTRSKAPFNLVGNFLGILGGNFSKFHVYGNSTSPIDMPGRFQYY